MVSGWQTKFSVSPGPGLWSLVLGPFGPDLGPDLDLTWDLDLDLSLTITIAVLGPSMTFNGRDLNSVQRSKEMRVYNCSYDCTGNVNKMRTALDGAQSGRRKF